ncbi:AEC family transporter [bacterium]|nr:AEC family transporter [bacterium]
MHYLQTFWSVWIEIIYVFLLILVGVFAKKINIISNEGSKSLSSILMNIAWPALLFSAMLKECNWSLIKENLVLIVIGALIVVIGYIIGIIGARIGSVPKPRKSAFLYACMINNYSFLPLPIVLILFGEKGIVLLALCNLGTILVQWTFGIYIVAAHRLGISSLKKIVNMPLIAIVSGMILSGFHVQCPKLVLDLGVVLMRLLNALGGTTVPIAMLIAGFALADINYLKVFKDKDVILINVLRLVVIPICTLILISFLSMPIISKKIASVVAIMPVAIAASVVIKQYGGDEEFTASAIYTTTVLSIITIPAFLTIILG